MFAFATQERSDQEPLLLGNGRKTSPKYRVGMFMLTFLFVGAIGSVLLFKQHAPITDAAVGEPLAAAPVGIAPDSAASDSGTSTATETWDFGTFECPAVGSDLMNKYGTTDPPCDCTKTKKNPYGLPAKGMGICKYDVAKPDCWPLPSWEEIAPKDVTEQVQAIKTWRSFWECHKDKFKIEIWTGAKKCHTNYYHGFKESSETYSKFIRDMWDGGDRNGFNRRPFNNDRVMCPAEKPICNKGECEDTSDFNGAAMAIDLGSGGTRPMLYLFGTKGWPTIKTKLYTNIKHGAFYGCQLNVAEGAEKDDPCFGNGDHFFKRTKQAMYDVLETLAAISDGRGADKPLTIDFVFGGVTAGGRDQAGTASGGALVPKLAKLKGFVKEFLKIHPQLNGRSTVDELDIIIRMITGQEEAYYAWLDANKKQIMDLAKDPGPLVPVSKEALATFKNTWERGGASAQFTLTVNADVNTYEDIYKFNLYGQDYYVWADSLVNGGINRLWSNFDKTVPLKDGSTTKKAFGEKTELTDDELKQFLGSVDRFFAAQKGLCGDIGLKDYPCGTPGSGTAGGSAPACAGDKVMTVGKHDQMLVEMEQRWTGLCVAGVKIPQTGIAQLDFEKVTQQKLTWTLVNQDLFGFLIPSFGKDASVMPADDSKCEWWKQDPFYTKPPPDGKNKESDATSGDNLTLEDYLTEDGRRFSEISTYYNNCFKKKNKAFLVALFYTRLFKRIEDGIKGSKYGASEPKSTPFQDAKFEYHSGKRDVEWTEAAAWMQVYNNRVREQFTTATKSAIELASSGSLEETVGSRFMLQPVKLPGTIIDLDSFEH